MEDNRKKLSGVFAPVVTPFRSGELALDDLRFNLKKLNETELAGYLALGSNGEFRSLTDAEQIQVLEVFAEEKSDKVIMVGTGCESTAQTIEKSKLACEMGFDYASVLTPCYFPKQINGATLERHYQRVADSIEIPVLLYNAPGFTGMRISPQTILELSEHPNIAGMKDSAPEGPVKLLARLDPANDFQVLAGSANFMYPTLHLGAAGGVMSVANFVPGPCCDLYRLFVEGRYDQAKELHFRISRINQAVSGLWGVAGVKAAMDIMGFRGGTPRYPLAAVTQDDAKQIKQQIVDEGFLSE
ncbi:MAG: dihydrodipicolinate synthase family protein [Planctomycetota bacterium]|jgi:4-hydroxy-2-oxoglutarate aldolase